MKKHQTNSINESSAEQALLDNLFNFCVAKYRSITDIEKHFLKSVGALIERGELEKSFVMSYLEEKGIEGTPTVEKPSINVYNDGGCGYSGYSRSHC
jgi:hypothetical protein